MKKTLIELLPGEIYSACSPYSGFFYYIVSLDQQNYIYYRRNQHMNEEIENIGSIFSLLSENDKYIKVKGQEHIFDLDRYKISII